MEGDLLGHELKNPLQGTTVGLPVGTEIMIKMNLEEIMKEREVGGDGHNHDQDLDPGPDPGQEAKGLHSLEMRGMVIHLLDGKKGGQMTVGEAPEEVIDIKEMNSRNRQSV